MNASAADEPPTPVIESVTPSIITASLSPQTFTITGHDFLSGASAEAVASLGTGSINLAQSVNVVSATKITFTIQCLPTESGVVDVRVLNPNGRQYTVAPAAMTLKAQLSGLTPIIFDETGDLSYGDPRYITTVVRALVTAHSNATLIFAGIVRVPYSPYSYSGVSNAFDDDGDGTVAFHSIATAPGNILFVVIDSTGAVHKTQAPFQAPLPDSNWIPQPHPQRSADGTMSRYDLDLYPDPGANLLWVRPGVGAWSVHAADHNAITDADGVPFWDGHAVVRAAVFQPVFGTAYGPPPPSFAPSDVVAILNDHMWSVERLPSPLTGSAGGSIRLFSDSTKEGTEGTVYVRRIAGSEGTVSVSYHTVDGTARAGVDYVATAGTLTFAPGEYVKTISIPTIDDGFYGNGTRNFSLAVAADAATVPTPVYTWSIYDAQNQPVVSVANVRVSEGDDASATVQVPVTFSGKSRLTARLTWQTVDDLQNSGPIQVLTFAPGETQKMIAVPYTGNTAPGPDRTITIHLNSPENVTLLNRSAVVTIVDDDTPQLSVSDIRFDERTAAAIFLVTMSRAVAAPVTVHYETADGTATSPLDYTGKAGVLTFAPGEVFKTVTVPVVFDDVVESDETFSLKLSQPGGATIARDTGVATILDSDPQPSPVVLVDDISVIEGNSGTTDATFNLHLSFASALPITAAWQTQNGSAHDDSDYAPAAGTLIFAPGETDKRVIVKITGDTAAEPNEQFRLVIAAASNALPGPGGACTIVNDDGQPPPSRRRPSR